MLAPMRRKDKAGSDAMIVDVLQRGEYGMLATIDEDGYPAIIPLNYVYFDNAIFFHCAKQGNKLNNIRRNNNVSFCVVTDVALLPSEFNTNYKSVIAFGEASEVTTERKEVILAKLVEKYSPDFIREGNDYIERAKDNTTVIQIDIRQLTGKEKA